MNHEADLVRKAAGLWWPNLPALLLGSVLVAGAWAVVRYLAMIGGSQSTHGSAISVLGIGLVVLPLIGALIDTCTVLLGDEHAGVRRLVRRFPITTWRAWRVSLPVTAVALLTTAADVAWQQAGQVWMLASWAVCSAALAGAVLVGVIALPYSLRPGVGWRDVWLVSAYLASRNPLAVLGIVAACTLAVWAAAYLSFAMLLLLPAPLALAWSAGASQASRRGRARLALRVGTSV